MHTHHVMEQELSVLFDISAMQMWMKEEQEEQKRLYVVVTTCNWLVQI